MRGASVSPGLELCALSLNLAAHKTKITAWQQDSANCARPSFSVS